MALPVSGADWSMDAAHTVRVLIKHKDPCGSWCGQMTYIKTFIRTPYTELKLEEPR